MTPKGSQKGFVVQIRTASVSKPHSLYYTIAGHHIHFDGCMKRE